MSISEIVVAAVEPAKKLIDAVSRAIGKAYEPNHIRKMADAKAYELSVIGEKLRNNSDLPIIYDSSKGYTIDTSDFEALSKRTGKRIAYQEVLRQENIETIVDGAYETVKEIESCAEGDITREWMHRFIDAAGDISTEEMQRIWSKVLAGEVLDPTSFSLRTLECLRNMDVTDARLFSSLCKLVINNMIISDNNFLEKHGILYEDILKLNEGGLISLYSNISKQFEISSEPRIVINFNDYILTGKSDKKTYVSIRIYPLTTAGKELSRIVDGKMDFETVKEICQIVQKNNVGVNFSLHKVYFWNGNQANYSEEAIEFNIDNNCTDY